MNARPCDNATCHHDAAHLYTVNVGRPEPLTVDACSWACAVAVMHTARDAA